MLPQNLELCLPSPRVEVVSCHANEAINRAARRKLCTYFAISLILSRYNSIRKKPASGQNNIGYDKQVEASNMLVLLTENNSARSIFILSSIFHLSLVCLFQYSFLYLSFFYFTSL
jgi:hypothetical protein